jgi:hypothetical protein
VLTTTLQIMSVAGPVVPGILQPSTRVFGYLHTLIQHYVPLALDSAQAGHASHAATLLLLLRLFTYQARELSRLDECEVVVTTVGEMCIHACSARSLPAVCCILAHAGGGQGVGCAPPLVHFPHALFANSLVAPFLTTHISPCVLCTPF